MQATQDNAATPFERRLTLKSRDGLSLGATLFEPRGEVRANLLIHGAVAVPQRFYARFGRSMAVAGLRVLTYDYRGVGDSRVGGLRGFDANLEDWAERDLPGAVDFIVEHYGRVPTFALGHSFGGQMLAVDAAARDALSGAFLVASQSGYYGTFEGRYKLLAGLLWFGILPVTTSSFGYLPGWTGIGVDLPRGCAEQWGDWCKSPDYFLATHPHYADALSQLSRPLHALSFSDDWYAPRVNVEWLLSRYGKASITHEHLSPAQVGASEVGHFGFFSPSQASRLWPRVIEFVDRVLERSTASLARHELAVS